MGIRKLPELERYKMRQINPYMAAANRQGEIGDEGNLRQRRWLKRRKLAAEGLKTYRLYSGDEPCGAVVACTPFAAETWNKNVRAFLAWQLTLGNEALPPLVLKEESITESCYFKIEWTLNGKPQEAWFGSANSVAHARRTFDEIMPVTARIISVVQVEDLELAVALSEENYPSINCGDAA
jgi:hypothetical protein